MSKTFNVHAILQKYDPFQGKFTAIASMGGVVDRENERLDYVGSKPEFQAWSASQYKASAGKSYGNLRLQHDAKRPAGILTSPIQFDDDNETIKIEGQIIDPIAKELMRLGALTGVSIGGAYKSKRSNPDGTVDYVAKPSEISVVDRPCLPQATFGLVKDETSGEVVMTKFADEKTADELISKFLVEADMSDATAKKLQKSIDDLSTAFNAYVKKAAEFGVNVAENDKTPVDCIGDEKSKEREVPNSDDPTVEHIAPVGTDEDGDFDEGRSGEDEDTSGDEPSVPMSTAKVAKGGECTCPPSVPCKCGKCACGKCEMCVKRDFSDKERAAAADSGAALPDGSFPIKTKQDLKNAIQAFGRAKDKAKAKAHIIARAKALGESELIPDNWKAQKADFSSPSTEATMAKNQTAEELEKAHKSVAEHIAACHKAAAEHCEAHKGLAEEHMKAIHDHLGKMHKAMTGEETVPMEPTKAEATGDLKKEDKETTMTDEKLAELVGNAVAKALGVEKKVEVEPTLEERIAKAVATAIEPLRKAADPNQSRPRYTEAVANPTVTDEQIAKAAAGATKGNRDAVREMFKDTANQMARRMAN